MKVLSVKVPEKLAGRLSSTARKQRVSKSELIRSLLERGLESMDEDPPSAYDLMKDGVGIVSSGHSDLATDERHLKGFGT